MFSNTTEYALRAVVFLAIHREMLSSSLEIAQATKSPPGYVSKILKQLASAGVVHSQRGPSGGFSLAKDPKRLSILDIIKVVDRFERIKECPLGLPEHGKSLCRLHKRLDDALGMIEKVLAESTIADMAMPKLVGGKSIMPTVGGVEPTARKAAPRTRR